jgi:hypothetical protein
MPTITKDISFGISDRFRVLLVVRPFYHLYIYCGRPCVHSAESEIRLKSSFEAKEQGLNFSATAANIGTAYIYADGGPGQV